MVLYMPGGYHHCCGPTAFDFTSHVLNNLHSGLPHKLRVASVVSQSY